ncbi:MAG TPA: DUF456 domain-containing protein [Phycisphaeraceae bacterium]|nr:DUF456 domain-containing protein [Phycisphaeraceae bacterium]
MHWVWAILILILGLFGPALALIGLPGVWLIILLSLLSKLVDPGMFSWWTIGVSTALALVGEILETGSSAVAVKVGKGSRRGMIWAVIGGIIGAIVGAPFGLLVGAILGGMIGAGLGAALAEITLGKSFNQASLAGGAAAAGRLAGVMGKTAVAMIVYVIIAVAAFWP